MAGRCIDLFLGTSGCRLDLQCGRRASFPATNLEDAVRDIALSAVDLARGRTFTSFQWRAEPGGVFVDINLGFEKATLVVHEMRDPDWGTRYWYPERAQVLFRLDAGPRQFVEDLFTALIGLPEQITASDRPKWGLPLPEDLLQELRGYLERREHNDLDAGE